MESTGIKTAIKPAIKPIIVGIIAISLSSCAAFRALMPGGVTPSDAEWSGVKSGEVVSISSQIDPRAESIANILSILGHGDPLGVLLPVTLIGESQPRWVLCTDELVAKCKAIPLNAKIHFAGESIGVGLLWKPKRLTAEDFND